MTMIDHGVDGAPKCRPLLRWAGSKKRQFAEISKFFPASFEVYVEPFAGSAAFLFRLGSCSAKINDLNRDVIEFYKHASTYPEKVYRSFISIPRSKESYYQVRESIKEMPFSIDRAASFYFLNRNCFNGIYRVNRKGHFNVPFSDQRVSPYLSWAEFQLACALLRRCQITNLDFQIFCDQHIRANDFVFLDPPYYSDGLRIFNEYATPSFASSDYRRLGETLTAIDRIGAFFLLCLPAEQLADTLSVGWRSLQTSVYRTVAGAPSSRRRHGEMLIMNYD